MEREKDREQIQFLLKKYLDPSSSIHLELNRSHIFRAIKNDAIARPASTATIKHFQESLSYFSRQKERYMLRGKKRHLNYRQYLSFAPETILCADLAFLHHLSPLSKSKSKTVLCLLDLFSKFGQGQSKKQVPRGDNDASC